MVRVITQETYDEVVKENMDEFEMTPEEAIKEAVAQFEAQGVDLSNIIKDLTLNSGDNHLVSEAVTKLKELSSAAEIIDDEVLRQMEIVKTECTKDIARRIRAGKEGAYSLIMNLLEARQKIYIEHKSEKDGVFIIAALNTLCALMDGQPDLLECKGIDFIKSSLENIQNEDITIATLQWTAKCCIKHEMNRQNIFKTEIVDNIKTLLQGQKNTKVKYKIISEVLQVVRKLTLDDDIRVEFGKAHEHAKEMGIKLLDVLPILLKDHTTPPLVSEIMLSIASLLVRNELCAAISDSVDDLLKVLAGNYDNGAVVLQAYKLITALAGNDDVKRKLVKSGVAPIIVSLLDRHKSNAISTAFGLKCVAALTLREPTHSKMFLDNGAAEAIVACMNIHENNDSVQRNACWAIRNMVARYKEQNSKFHELGIEKILNSVFEKYHQDFGFDIKSALRDLDCNVKLDEQWKGTSAEIEQ